MDFEQEYDVSSCVISDRVSIYHTTGDVNFDQLVVAMCIPCYKPIIFPFGTNTYFMGKYFEII